jgi:Transposase
VAEAAKNPRAPGRPGRLTPEVADAIVARVAAGDSVTSAATAAGVGLRTLRRWRRSAYSRDPRDATAVALERRIVRALSARPRASTPESWEQIAERLESEHPERWASLPELDEVLDDFGEVA